jgi:DNA-binding transcriptional MerR regulator
MDPDHAAESAAPQQLLTLVEAAALLRTPVATLRYWRQRGIGPDSFRLGRRVVYRREDLDRWVLSRRNAEVRR